MPTQTKAKRGKGRPPQGRTERLTVRLSPEAKEMLQLLRETPKGLLSEGTTIEWLIKEAAKGAEK